MGYLEGGVTQACAGSRNSCQKEHKDIKISWGLSFTLSPCKLKRMCTHSLPMLVTLELKRADVLISDSTI